MESHEKVIRQAGATQEQVQTAVRIAAVVHAVAVTLEAEAALAAPLTAPGIGAAA
jgi:alkyl hydroperoxide reductase subunit D